MSSRRVLPVFALVFLAATSAASAAPKAKSEARTLAAEAKKALKERRYADAEAALRRSDELEPSPQTRIDLAEALAAEGKLVAANQALHGAADVIALTAATEKLRGAVNKLLADLAPRIPSLQVDVSGPPRGKAQTSIDDKVVDASSEVPLDPGEHRISVTADGFAPVEKTVTLKEGAHEHARIELASTTRPIAHEAPPPSHSAAPMVAALSVGVAGLLVGGGAGIAALVQARDAKSQCVGTVCPPSAADAIDRSKLSGTISTIGFITGGVGVGLGLVLWIASPSADKKATASREGVRLAPWIGVSQAGLRGTF